MTQLNFTTTTISSLYYNDSHSHIFQMDNRTGDDDDEGLPEILTYWYRFGVPFLLIICAASIIANRLVYSYSRLRLRFRLWSFFETVTSRWPPTNVSTAISLSLILSLSLSLNLSINQRLNLNLSLSLQHGMSL